MAHFNDLPNEILELIFNQLDFKTRRQLTPVCRRWNSVLFSKRFIDRNVFLTIKEDRILHSTPSLHRKYSNVAVRLEGGSGKTFFRNKIKCLRAWLALVPSPTGVRLFVNRMEDPRLVAILEERLIDLSTVETLYLHENRRSITANSTSAPLQLQMNRLRTLHVDVCSIEKVRFRAPNLREMRLVMRSNEHLPFLRKYVEQLHSLSVGFSGYHLFNFTTCKMNQLRHLSINIPTPGWRLLVKHNFIVAILNQCEQLERLELSAPRISEALLKFIVKNQTNLVDLRLALSTDFIPDWRLQEFAQCQTILFDLNLQQDTAEPLCILTLIRAERLHTLTLHKAELCAGNRLAFVRRISNCNFTRVDLALLIKLENIPKFIGLFPALRCFHVRNGLHYSLDVEHLKQTHPQLVVSIEASTTLSVWDSNTTLLCTFSGQG
ncbi:hypothetical protein ZHAS_00022336 [Anopheles sinensis]|uniref:F-box domain-containing protein n=1 Tax=Anopheles sinensis TaxID=74873 RepID=A0A084WUJ6_ANOSI|nr:hypothetical protein ZHAS_00022336 [Anopheles sinensis]